MQSIFVVGVCYVVSLSLFVAWVLHTVEVKISLGLEE